MVTNQQISEQCNCAKLRSASRVITRIYEEELREVRLKPSQFTLLVAIDLTSPMPITQLSTELDMERTTLTRNLLPLERQGLVVMSSGHGRIRYTNLSAQGKQLLEQAKPLWEKAQKRVDGLLGQGDSDLLSRVLNKLKTQQKT